MIGLLQIIFAEYGIPAVVHTDQGAQFVSGVFRAIDIPGPFYEAQFGIEIFVELYILRIHHQSPPKCGKDTLPFYFINFSVVVYCYYGYLPIS